MARSFAAASSQNLAVGSAAIANPPLTIAAWFWPNSLISGSAYTICCVGDSAVTNKYYRLGVYQNKVISQQTNGGASQYSQTSGTITDQDWQHGAAVMASTTSRIAYLNATAATENTTSVTALTLNQTCIGTRPGTGAEYFNGRVAHAAMWSVALSAPEIAALYAGGIGADPRSVRPDALVAYWPLLDNDGDRDWWGSTHLSATNSPTYAQHPPLLMKSKPTYVLLGTAGAAPTISSVTVTGTSQIGNTLTATVATSPAEVDSIAYRWQQAPSATPDPGDIDVITGETASTLALTYTDFATLLDAGDAYVRCGAIATEGAQDSDEAFSAWQQVNVPAGAGFAGSPLKSPFLIA